MEGFVYLIGSTLFGWYKIGKAKNPKIRVEDLGILLPFKVEILAVWKAKNHTLMEASLHEKYAEHHINGEWFSFTPDKIQEIINRDVPVASKVTDDVFSSFSNIENDAPEGKRIVFQVKKFYTKEQQEIKKQENIAKRAERRALAQKV